MRPVNLIPHDERRGGHAPNRTGVLPYILVGALAVAVLAVSAVVLTGKQIDDRTAEKASLEAQVAETTAQANALAPYTSFATLSQARSATVTSLAQSRFDWERVMRELALVLPDDVWLTGLTGTVSPETGLSTTATDDPSITGPALSITGCATGHDAVAGFLEALKDIDGVTRVGIGSSERGAAGGTAAGGGGSANTTDCKTRSFITQFTITVAFDNVAAAATAAPAAPAAPAPSSEGPELADARQGEQQARDSGAEQSDKSRQAANIIPGVAK